MIIILIIIILIIIIIISIIIIIIIIIIMFDVCYHYYNLPEGSVCVFVPQGRVRPRLLFEGTSGGGAAMSAQCRPACGTRV